MLFDDAFNSRHSISSKQLLSLTPDGASVVLPAQALQRERENLQLILDYAPIGIWLQNGKGRMSFVNRAFCEATVIHESRFLAVDH